MKRMIFSAALLAAAGLHADFNWGGDCEPGNGSFSQQIQEKSVVTIGEIPIGKSNVKIYLNSESDVDIQLFDKETGKAIVKWAQNSYEAGLLNGPNPESTTYEGLTYEYSGYKGQDGKPGNEYIKIHGNTNRVLVMKAYGFKAGNANVTYEWEAADTCREIGSGSFSQDIPYRNSVEVGKIPVGKTNVRIDLESTVDVDVQLWDGDKAIIAWSENNSLGALLYGKTRGEVNYKGTKIIYSGYDGVNGNPGKEYIEIKGTTTTEFTMKAFGYAAGTASVDYRWGTGVGESCGGWMSSCEEGLACKDSVCHTPEWCNSKDDCSNLGNQGEAGSWSCEEFKCKWNLNLSLEDGAVKIENRSNFDTLAVRGDFPGALQVPEVKFVVVGVDTPDPKIYFINSNKYERHYYFLKAVFGWTLTDHQFNQQTYFSDSGRKNLAGSLIARDNYAPENGEKGVYTVQFLPTDPIKFEYIKIAYDLVTAGMPYAPGKVRYLPAGETQKNLYQSEKAKYDASTIQVISNDDLFGNVSFSALNLGESYGLLKLVEDKETISAKDIVIFKSIPNDLTHVSGIITDAPQTPLCHINLKAKQNNTPNSYIKGAATDPAIAPLIGKYVHYKVTADGFEIEEATQAEVDNFFESIRPQNPQIPERNLSVTTLANLDDIGNANADAYGSKAANVAELRKILPAGMVPDGFGIPFYYYDEYMKHNNFYAEAQEMMNNEEFKSDPAKREADLKAFRKKLKKGEVPQWMDDAIEAKYQELKGKQPEGQNIRARSSTNNEDLVGFNGAGLYDSNTHKQDATEDEGRFIKTVRQVWSSLWTYRAFEEREFYRIDHTKAAMGVLVHPNYKDELANGVAVTKNIYEPRWEGFYVNVQVGEDLVTNPDAESIPDEYLISRKVSDIDYNYEYETIFIRHSNQTTGGTNVLSDTHAQQLISAMEKIQSHFKRVYNAQYDSSFAMDIEFKVTKDNELHIKQARPWVD